MGTEEAKRAERANEILACLAACLLFLLGAIPYFNPEYFFPSGWAKDMLPGGIGGIQIYQVATWMILLLISFLAHWSEFFTPRALVFPFIPGFGVICLHFARDRGDFFAAVWIACVLSAFLAVPWFAGIGLSALTERKLPQLKQRMRD